KKLAEFYAVQMKGEVPIEYILKDLRESPDYSVALRELKREVAAKIETAFQ
nr:hypothetical protein [Chloroflexota bacterium]